MKHFTRSFSLTRLLSAMLFTALSAAISATSPAYAQKPSAADIAVQVDNKSEPVLCAEKDNVYVPMSSPDVKSFRIQAVHPAYIGGLVADRFAADWTSCDMTGDPTFTPPKPPRKITFYETTDMWLVGYTFPTFWRPANVPFKVGDRVEEGLHIVQLWQRVGERVEEILVVYPPDGYWRARPMPPAHMKWSAYGSSFLVGPIEQAGRPVVAFKDISFDPATKTFTMNFVKGGAATLTVSKIDDDKQVLDVKFTGERPKDLPFAALRSMYITETNNDAARIAWRGDGNKTWGEKPLMDFTTMKATEIWAGRHVHSRHNTSAPDMVFSKFEK